MEMKEEGAGKLYIDQTEINQSEQQRKVFFFLKKEWFRDLADKNKRSNIHHAIRIPEENRKSVVMWCKNNTWRHSGWKLTKFGEIHIPTNSRKWENPKQVKAKEIHHNQTDETKDKEKLLKEVRIKEHIARKAGISKVFLKGLKNKYFRFAGHMMSVTTTQYFYCLVKAATDNM